MVKAHRGYSFFEYVQHQAAAFIRRCTPCDRCFRACPMVEMTSLKGAQPEKVIEDVLGILRGEKEHRLGQQLLEVCTKCGQCLDVCPQGLNPRKMLSIATYRLVAMSPPKRPLGGAMLRMSQQLKVVAGLQMTSEELRLFASRRPGLTQPVDVIFHVSCNLLLTPHIMFNVMRILEELGISYVTLGGIPYCCGTYNLRGGDSDPALVTENTLNKFAAFRPQKVLSWCPTCLMVFNESTKGLQATPFVVEHFVDFLAEHLDAWVPRARPVRKRIAVHLHPSGIPATMRNARAVLEHIPGLTIVDLPGTEDLYDWSYTCSGALYARYHEAAARARKAFFEQAQAAGADTVVTVYHTCHRFLCDAERDYPLHVKNVTSLVMEALGLEERDDKFKRFKLTGDVKRILQDARECIEMNHLDVRFAEESLPAMLAGRWL